MPDVFKGDGVPPDVMDDPAKRATFNWGAWIGAHPPDVVLKDIVTPVLNEVKASQGVKKVAAIGFWYGYSVTFDPLSRGRFPEQML